MPRNRDGAKTTINHVVVTGYEKRRAPSKHYVYVIDVTWDNDERYEIFRRYSDFFTLQEALKIVFPEAANTLPSLPKKKFIGRSQVESVAEARLEALNKYCQSLICMEEKVSKSKQVMAFFLSKIGDKQLPKLRLNRPPSLHPQIRPEGNNTWIEYCVIATFTAEKPSQISAESGDQVILINKDISGWDLVERKGKVGWIPDSYLKKTKTDNIEDYLGVIGPESSSGDSKKESSPEMEGQEYTAIDSYTPQGPGQIGFEEGEVITVLDKLEDGWWFVSKDDEEGWVPCGYLEPLNQIEEEEEIETSSLDKESYKTVAPYTAEEEDEISFSSSMTVEVLQKSLTGWWLIKCNHNVGLAPATYLKKVENMDTEETISIDSGIESGSEKPAEALFKNNFSQVPRQKTVRKKRSTKKGNETRPQLPTDQSKKPPPLKTFSPKMVRKLSDPVSESKPKTSPLPRKNSQQEDKPLVSPKPQRLHVQGTGGPGTKIDTPPRPRQSQINRAWKSVDKSQQNHKSLLTAHEEQDERGGSKEKSSRGFSPSKLFGRRSPSPRGSPVNISPRVSPLLERREHSLSPPSNEIKFNRSNSKTSPLSPPSSNPFTQAMIDSMLKYILASDDPSLKTALREAVLSDPLLVEELKKK